MKLFLIILGIVLAVLIVAFIVLTIVGKKLQKKQEDSKAQMEAASQIASIQNYVSHVRRKNLSASSGKKGIEGCIERDLHYGRKGFPKFSFKSTGKTRFLSARQAESAAKDGEMIFFHHDIKKAIWDLYIFLILMQNFRAALIPFTSLREKYKGSSINIFTVVFYVQYSVPAS